MIYLMLCDIWHIFHRDKIWFNPIDKAAKSIK
ncbi:hypothetical protein EMIT093MI4_60082 [Pseudomonas sp. IT-93MI4]